MKNKRAIFLRILSALLAISVLVGCAVLGINVFVKQRVKDRILTLEQASELCEVDCVLVLGCLVKGNGAPSDMLEDRLSRGVELYGLSVSPKILMSGDHGTVEYNEVGAMKDFALDEGVPSEDVFMDHAGFSTYDSIYRAKEIFGASKIVIVTQEYHLYRALYVARSLGLDAYGVPSDQRTYRGQIYRDAREILARNKDFFLSVFKPQASILGEPISIKGDGDITNDY